MALTLTSTPDKVSLTGNPIEFTIHSDNVFSTAGTKFRANILPSNFSAYNADLTFTWGTNTYKTYCRQQSSFDVGEHPYFNPYNNKNTYLKQFIECILKDFELSRDFYITQETTHSGKTINENIVIEAKEIGSEFQLTCNIANGFVVTRAGASNVMRDFFRIGWQLEIKNQTTLNYEAIGDVQLETPDENGNIIIDVSEFIQDELTGHYTWPEKTPLIVTQNDIRGEFRIKYFEYYGNPSTYQACYYSGSFYYLQGKISQLRMSALKQLGQTFWEWLCQKQKFLSFSPDSKTISKRQPEKLYYIVMKAGISQIKITIKIYYSDGTNSGNQIAATLTANQYRIYELLVGYGMLNIGNYAPSKTVTSYDVWVADQNNAVISEIKSFFVDADYYEINRYFMYRNSLGVFETFWATGKGSKEVAIDKEFITVPVSADYALDERALKQSSSERAVTYQCNTGFKTRDMINYAPEFLESPDVYVLDKLYAYPVNILAGDYSLEVDKEGIYHVDFTYEFAMKADSTEEFLRIRLKGDFNSDFNNDLY